MKYKVKYKSQFGQLRTLTVHATNQGDAEILAESDVKEKEWNYMRLAGFVNKILSVAPIACRSDINAAGGQP